MIASALRAAVAAERAKWQAALVECWQAGIPEGRLPDTEIAEYIAKTLPEQLRGINRLLHGKSMDRNDAVAAEREACAKIAEQYRDALENWQDTHICGEIAAKIRARSGTDN